VEIFWPEKKLQTLKKKEPRSSMIAVPLDPGQIIFFHLRGKKEASGNNIVVMTYRNTISNKVIKIIREFPIS
jgi:hypothetical protein